MMMAKKTKRREAEKETELVRKIQKRDGSVVPFDVRVTATGHRMTFSDKISGKNRAETRSKTFEGIADAISEQWIF